MLSMQNAGQVQTMKFQKDRMKDMLKQADELDDTMNRMKHMYGLMTQLTNMTHHMVGETHEMQAITDELRDHIADFEDFWRPIRSYFYWEKHCYDIPICWSLRSIFDALDGVDEIDDKLHDLVKDFSQLDVLMPQLIAQFPPMIDTMENMRTMMLTMHSTMSGIFDQMDDMSTNANAMGQAFDTAKNDDSFYLPPEVFKNKDFKRALNIFLSPDGKAARLIISQRGDPASPEGIARVDPIKSAAEEALKGTPLEDAKIYLAGTAATFKDWKDGSKYDLMIAGVGALCLIFIIMLIITRSLIAALVIVGTVAISLGASFGIVCARLAVPARHQTALDGAGDVGDRAVGGRVRLQPAAGLPDERGNSRRDKHRHHSRDGQHRQGRDDRRPGVRVHDGVDGGQRPAHHRSGGHHHRPGSAVRHVGRALVHDAVHRRAARTLVLVADQGAPAARQHHVADQWAPSRGAVAARLRASVSPARTSTPRRYRNRLPDSRIRAKERCGNGIHHRRSCRHRARMLEVPRRRRRTVSTSPPPNSTPRHWRRCATRR